MIKLVRSAVAVVLLAGGLDAAVAVAPAAAAAPTRSAGGPAPATDSPAPGTYVATTPTRVLDTRTGAYGNRGSAVGANRGTSPRVTGSSGVPSSAAAVAVTISVVAATRSGGITASTYGPRARPNVTHVQFAAGSTATGDAVVPVTSGRIDLWNASAGSVQLVMDVVGYYVGGPPTDDGALRLVTPRRVVDTRSGLNGYHHAALSAHGTMSPNLRLLGAVPANAGAVAATVTVVSATRSGSLVSYASATTRPVAPLLDFTAGRAASQFAFLPLSDIQGLSLYNTSTGSVQVVVDVFGYLPDAPAAVPGAHQVVTANRIFSDSVLPGRGVDRVPVLGVGGIPRAGVAAVVVAVRASRAGKAGSLAGSIHLAPTVLSFAVGRSSSAQAVLPVSSGTVTIRNVATAGVAIEVDVVGYVPSTPPPGTPKTDSVARYLNGLTGTLGGDENHGDRGTMTALGTADGQAGATFVLLDLGAQTVTSPLSAANPGVALALTKPVVRYSYADLRTLIDDYLTALAAASGGRAVTVAVGTNNDGDWAAYKATKRGADYRGLILGLPAHAGITVVGANDIEAQFGSQKAADAIAWEDAFLDGGGSPGLVFNGALLDCPTVFGSRAGCAFGWTQQDYVQLVKRPGVQVLPQVYFAVQAVQWANVYATGGGGIRFLGSLTENAADPSTYTAVRGWAALVRALQWRVTTPVIARAVDLGPMG